MSQTPDTRKHFYNLEDQEDRAQAQQRIWSFKQLALDGDKSWRQSGYWHILVNQLCLLFRYRKEGDILLIEWKTRHKSEIELPQ